ncbi:MAG TPA: hypothetical protein ENJ66_00845, partial [Calditrichae bacterium]|nr:hypothetical protein [Calditrichia bacterium]
MMTKLREMSKLFLYLLVVAFLALMVLEWGADITGRSAQGNNIVGKINGHEITVEEYNQMLQNAYENERQRTGGELSDADMKRLQNEVWENIIQQILLQEQIKKMGIKVTKREIAYHSVHNPPQYFRNIPAFLTNGQFDINKYRQALQNPQVEQTVVSYVAQNLPFQKLLARITAAVMVTEEEVKDAYMRQSMRAKVEYVGAPLYKFSSKEVEVSEEEAKKYYEEHKDDFKVEEKRVLNYVLFSTAPTHEDTMRVYRLAEDILKEAKSGADFAKLADEYSEDPSVQTNHGDLGYFKRGDMDPAFEKAAFSGKPGDIIGPVKTRFGLHIIKIVDRKKEDGVEKVRASHILLRFNASASTVEDARDRADEFAQIAKESGFKVAADRLKYKIEKTPPFVKRNFIPGLGLMEGAVEWAFHAEKGEISDPFRAQTGYVVFEVAEIQLAGYRPFEEVKAICINRIKTEKRKQMARDYALKFADAVKS